MALDTTMHDQSPTGSATSQKANKYDSTMTCPFGQGPSPNEGDGSQRHANVENSNINKSADNGIISPKFYESVSGSPGSLDSTLDDSILEIKFNR